MIRAYLSQRAAFENQFTEWIAMGLVFPEMACKGVDDMEALKAFVERYPFLKTHRTDKDNP